MPIATFADIIAMTRSEAGRSTNVSMGLNDQQTIQNLINRIQWDLYLNYDWPQLIVLRDVPLSNSGRYIAYPSDLAFDDVVHAWVLVNTVYCELGYGIGPDEWRLWNSDLGYKSWPTLRWMHNADTNMAELWPVPDANAEAQLSVIRFRGTKRIVNLVNPGDTSILDGTMLALYVASELLARDGDKSAPLKLKAAQQMQRRIQVRQNSHKQRPFVVGGGGGYNQQTYRGRIGLEYVPPGYGSGPGTIP